jgi:GT2 family glycosyltransferase
VPIESSLIIITRNRAGLLGETLESLTGQTRGPAEVIVVDNGPSQETAAVVARFGSALPVRYVVEPRSGYGPARNRGLAEARGEILFFLDDDCVAERGWAETLRRALDGGEAEMVGGSRDCGRRGLAARLEYLSTDGPVLHPGLRRGPVRHLSTANLAMRRAVAERVGRFDETLVMCEDRDFCARARAAGFRLLYEPAARVRHQPPVERLSQYLAKMRHYGLGTSQYFLRWREAEPLARLFPRHPALRLLLLPALAALGTGYLVVKNLPQRPDAVWLSPLIFAGQLWWHWGGFEATRRERRPC